MRNKKAKRDKCIYCGEYIKTSGSENWGCESDDEGKFLCFHSKCDELNLQIKKNRKERESLHDV